MTEELFFMPETVQALARCVLVDYGVDNYRKTRRTGLFYYDVISASFHLTVLTGGNVAVIWVLTDRSKTWPPVEQEPAFVGGHFRYWAKWPLSQMPRLMRYVKVLEPIRIDCITAHGLAGAVAQLLGLAISRPVVSFGSPGTLPHNYLVEPDYPQLHFVGVGDERVLACKCKHIGAVEIVPVQSNDMLAYYRALAAHEPAK